MGATLRLATKMAVFLLDCSCRFRLLVLVFVLSPVLGKALVSQGGSLGTGARAMGQAGAVVASKLGSEALFWNPANLGGIGDWETALHSGMSPYSGNRSAFALSGAIDGLGHAGLALSDARLDAASPFRENWAHLGLALPLGETGALGMAQKFVSADPGGLRGWSMDLGLRFGLPLANAWGKRLDLGFAATDLVSSLAWSNGVEELQPLGLQGGVTWMGAAWSLAAQLDRIDRPGSVLQQWRVGGAWDALGSWLTLRAGATSAQSGPLYVTAGLGTGIYVGATRWQLDYATVMPTESGTLAQTARQLLSLSAAFGVKLEATAEPEAELDKILTDPRTGKVKLARIGLRSAEGIDTKDWELAITDKRGRVLRTFKGKGALPPSVAWDGKGMDGRAVASDGLTYALRTTDPTGRQSEKRSMLAPANAALSADYQTVGDNNARYGLRPDETMSQEGARPKVRPSLKGADSLGGASFDLSDVDGASTAKRWELRVVDAEGKTVKKFSGTGRPPKDLRWEGNDDLGQPVAGALGAGYVLRVEDESGKAKVLADELVTQASLGEAMQARQTRDDDQDEASSAVCRKDSAGTWTCVVHFSRGAQALDRQGRSEMRRIAKIIKGRKFAKIEIEGSAASEGDDMQALAQARADQVLRVMVEKYGANAPEIVSSAIEEDALGASAWSTRDARRVQIRLVP